LSNLASPLAVVLGAAAGGGFPQWNCRCRVCSLAWAHHPNVRWRSQSSLAITADGESWLLVNASPDLGQQLRATPALWPRTGPRQSPVTAVVLTSGEIDHCAGLLTLRERQPLRLIGTAPTLSVLEENPVFRALSRDLVPREAMRPGERLEVGGLALELIAVPGKVPLFKESGEPEIGSEAGETVAIAVEAGGRRLLYIPGCAGLTEPLRAELDRAEVVLFDGTLFTEDEMRREGVGEKTGRRMGHMPITGEGGSLEALAACKARRRIYTHINNTNPILIEDSPERRVVEAAGIEVAHDGMEIAF
jgi:pyrroloquinoline quinone biosynthesis protein B